MSRERRSFASRAFTKGPTARNIADAHARREALRPRILAVVTAAGRDGILAGDLMHELACYVRCRTEVSHECARMAVDGLLENACRGHGPRWYLRTDAKAAA